VISVRPAALKAADSIVVTVAGRVIVVRAVVFSNALALIVVTVAGMKTAVRLVQPLNILAGRIANTLFAAFGSVRS
jgi:hypothetical protein